MQDLGSREERSQNLRGGAWGGRDLGGGREQDEGGAGGGGWSRPPKPGWNLIWGFYLIQNKDKLRLNLSNSVFMAISTNYFVFILHIFIHFCLLLISTFLYLILWKSNIFEDNLRRIRLDNIFDALTPSPGHSLYSRHPGPGHSPSPRRRPGLPLWGCLCYDIVCSWWLGWSCWQTKVITAFIVGLM